MLMKYAVAGVAASALLANVAFAQTTSATTDSATTAAPAATADASSLKGNWRTSKLVGLNVYNDSNDSLGSINDLLTDKNGDIKAVVIGVGGFLGVGEHLVAVPLDKVKFVDDPIAYTGAAGYPADRKTFEHDDDGCSQHRAGCCGEEESVVSGSRRVLGHQGSAEGDAGVQVRDRIRRLDIWLFQMAGRHDAARPFAFVGACWRIGAAHPVHDALPDVRLSRGRSTPASCPVQTLAPTGGRHG